MWNKHPKALPYLFLSEMWERFGYYLMIGIFTALMFAVLKQLNKVMAEKGIR